MSLVTLLLLQLTYFPLFLLKLRGSPKDMYSSLSNTFLKNYKMYFLAHIFLIISDYFLPVDSLHTLMFFQVSFSFWPNKTKPWKYFFCTLNLFLIFVRFFQNRENFSYFHISNEKYFNWLLQYSKKHDCL